MHGATMKLAEYMLIRCTQVFPLPTFALGAGYPDSNCLDLRQNLTKVRIIKRDLKYEESEILLMVDIAFFLQ
jgi:hypothetical protein